MRTLTKTEIIAIERQALAFNWSEEEKQAAIKEKQNKIIINSYRETMLKNNFENDDGIIF